MLDAQMNIIKKRLSRIKRVIVISGVKGGVGKSLVSTALALCLSKNKKSVGLLDLDLSNPCLHTILGIKMVYPKEDKGILPVNYKGIKFFSLVFYLGKNLLALRRKESSNIFIEMFSIVQWGRLDFLIIDTPAGIGEVFLDILRFIPNSEFLLVYTPSLLSVNTVKGLKRVLDKQRVKILGVIENMYKDRSFKSSFRDIRFLGRITFDERIEECLGNPICFYQTEFFQDVEKITKRLWSY